MQITSSWLISCSRKQAIVGSGPRCSYPLRATSSFRPSCVIACPELNYRRTYPKGKGRRLGRPSKEKGRRALGDWGGGAPARSLSGTGYKRLTQLAVSASLQLAVSASLQFFLRDAGHDR